MAYKVDRREFFLQCSNKIFFLFLLKDHPHFIMGNEGGKKKKKKNSRKMKIQIEKMLANGDVI